MDWEAPADAWYVWIAVAIVSVAVAGVALAFPTEPPPDATRAANVIEDVSATPDGSASYAHDAESVKFEGPTLAMRNEGGTSRASVTYGAPVPVLDHERLEAVAFGTPVETAYADERRDGRADVAGAFLEDATDALEETDGTWHAASGELAVRTVRVDGDRPLSVSATGSTSEEYDLGGTAATRAAFDHADGDDRSLDVVLSGRPFTSPAGAVRSVEATLPATDARTAVDLLPPDATSHTDALRYPIDVEISANGSLECTGVIETSEESHVVCGPEVPVEDVAAEFGRISTDPETGEYRVTLVTA